MNDWATSPWATSNATPSLSPAPPAFAKTSPSPAALGSGYFDGFSNEAGWADTVTSGAGTIGGTENVAGLQSPRPIASPGRVANGKGNRYIRPILSIWDTQESEENELETVGGTPGQLDEVPGLRRTENVDDIVVANGGIEVGEDHWNTAGIVENGLRIDMEDMPGDPIKNGALHTPRLNALQAEVAGSVNHTEQDPSSNTTDDAFSLEQGITPSFARAGAHEIYSTPPPPRFPHSKIDFSIDQDLLAELLKRNIEETDIELPMLDTIITTSSQRKAQHRLTRPYSLRQYSLGEFENYRRVTWASSTIHDEVINVVGKWIAKDRASGGGMFDATLANKSGSFGWGSEGRRATQGPEVSASSILLPKIAGPSGFNWSSSSMVPLSPRKLGEIEDDAPRASEDIKQMQPRQRRTPIRRKPRAVSGKALVSPKSPTIMNGAWTDSLDDLISPQNGAIPPLAEASGDEASVNDTPTLGEHDMSIFEQNSEVETAFEDFIIAPPPATSLPTPVSDAFDGPLQVDEYLNGDNGQNNLQQPRSSSGTVGAAAEVTSPSLQRTYVDELGSPSMLHTQQASPVKETSEDQSLVFDQSEDFGDFDDFDAFESAPPLEYTDTPDVPQRAHEEEPQFDHQTPTLETEISVQPGSRDSGELETTTPRSCENEGVVETSSDGFSAFESSLPPSVLATSPRADAVDMSVALHTQSEAVEAMGLRSMDDDTDRANVVGVHNEDSVGATMFAQQDPTLDSEPAAKASQSDHGVPASLDIPVATRNGLDGLLSVNDIPVSTQTFTAFDDFSIFETPINNLTPSNPPASQPESINLNDHDPAQTPTPLNTHSKQPDPPQEDDDDDFGAFEDAGSPLPTTPSTAWPSLAPPTISAPSSSWTIQNRYSIPLSAQTMSFTPLVPDLAPPRSSTAPPLSLFPTLAGRGVNKVATSLLSTAGVPLRPSSAFALQPLTTEIETPLKPPQPPRTAQMAPISHATASPLGPTTQLKPTATPSTPATTTTNLPPPKSTPIPKPAPPRPAPNPRHDAGNAILGVLAFLDAEDDASAEAGADAADDPFGAWSGESGKDGAKEALVADEEMIRRARREEWVGERPGEGRVEVGKGKGKGWGEGEGEGEVGKGEDEVDQDAVQRVVGGLPDWGFLL